MIQKDLILLFWNGKIYKYILSVIKFPDIFLQPFLHLFSAYSQWLGILLRLGNAFIYFRLLIRPIVQIIVLIVNSFEFFNA